MSYNTNTFIIGLWVSVAFSVLMVCGVLSVIFAASLANWQIAVLQT